jgi:hypothetical protein
MGSADYQTRRQQVSLCPRHSCVSCQSLRCFLPVGFSKGDYRPSKLFVRCLVKVEPSLTVAHRFTCSLCRVPKPTTINHFSDQYLEMIREGRRDVRCKACTSNVIRTDLECNDCHQIKSIDEFSKTQRKRGDEAVWHTHELLA